jgi:cytochrome c oxidase cbb3-type subunit 3
VSKKDNKTGKLPGKVDELSGVETTGHEWDGIRELDNPLPRWWLWTWYACILFAIGYWVLMPSWPLVSGYTKGLLGYSQRRVVEQEVAEMTAKQAGLKGQIIKTDLAQIEQNPELQQYAMAAGSAAFANNCAPCHGSGAQGAKGYPNLNDDDWLWGGKVEDIYQTIRFGVRAQNDQTRNNIMSAFLKDGILQKNQVADVVEYVREISHQEYKKPEATRGQAIFAENCVACHGEKGTGNTELGAPNLTDAIWLYGGDRTTITQTVSYGRGGVMPAWEVKLEPATIRSLAVFIHSRGGGK